MTAPAPVRPDDPSSGQARPAWPAPGYDPAWEMIRMEDATVRFGDLTAVRNISLSLPRGTILGVIGPSGAGKTTTIRLLTGGLNPTSGRVEVLGEDPRRFHRRTRERIGYMPQQFTLYPDLTAGENIDFVASLFGLLWFRRRRRVREVLHIVDLWEARGRRAANLSGGQQRRLELACALVHEPELLFLDEPTAGIDPLLRARVWEELHRIKETGRTMLVTTQYVNEAEECDLVALIAQGRLAALATPEELRRMATGGDVIEIETEAAFEASTLTSMDIVRSITQTSPHAFRVVVPDAGSATPDVVAAVDRGGGRVVSAREYRLSFDEIFAELVQRNRLRVESETEAVAASERNEAEARSLVQRELRQRAADSETTPLDDRAAVEEARQADVARHDEAIRQADMEAPDRDEAPPREEASVRDEAVARDEALPHDEAVRRDPAEPPPPAPDRLEPVPPARDDRPIDEPEPASATRSTIRRDDR